MNNNSGIIGIAAVILIAAAAGQEPSFSSLKSHSPKHTRYAGMLPGAFDLISVLKDLHRVTDIINRMDNLGQMVLNPPPTPKLPSPGDLLDNSMPDLSGIIINIGPLLSVLGKNTNNYTDNSFDDDYGFED